MKNCYVYSHYTFGIGHIQRASLLAKGLSQKFRVFLFYSGAYFDIKFDEIHKVMRLPAEIKRSRGAKSTIFESNAKNEQELVKNRIDSVIEEFRKNEPHVFITEFFPFASFRLNKTIIPLLEYIKSNYPNCKIVCSARDFPISDREDISKYNKNRLKHIIKKYYDLILIHAPYELSMFKPLNPIFEDIKDINIKFTGYIVGKIKKTISRNTKNKILIAVGGGRDGEEFIKKIIDASSLSRLRDEFKIKVITGPFSNYSLQQTNMHFKKMSIKKYVPNLGSNLRNYQCVITMAGYNTIAEILLANVNAIIFPRPNSYEQKARAIRISELSKNINMIDEKTILIELKNIIEEKLRLHPIKLNLPQDYFNGIEISVNEVVKLIKNG